MRPPVRLVVPLGLASLAAGVVAAAPASQAHGTGSPNVTHVAQLAFDDLWGEFSPDFAGGNEGTDLEFATMDVDGVERTYALVGTYHNGLQVFDVTDPGATELVSVWDCAISQGDVQVFQREDGAGTTRTYVAYAYDDGYGGHAPESECIEWAQSNAPEQFAVGDGLGVYIADVSDPANPRTVSLVGHANGSHNITVHPSGDWFYNSNSDLFNFADPAIEVTDVRDLSNPVHVTTLALEARPGLSSESHDISFSADGTRAYSAAIGHTTIIDTTDPANPSVISTLEDPAINVEHQAEVVTIADQVLGERDFLIVEDEFAGATGTDECPSGGVHVYDVTGPLEAAPVKVGFWNLGAQDFGPASGSCTAHVFDIHPEEQLMTIAFYNGGVRVVDLSNLVGVALGGDGMGMVEIAHHRFADSDTWAVKAPRVSRDGAWHLFTGDLNRGMDVFEVDLSGGADQASSNPGEWLTPDQVLGRALLNPVDLTNYTPSCLLGARP